MANGDIFNALTTKRLPPSTNLENVIRWVMTHRPEEAHEITEEGIPLWHVLKYASTEEFQKVEADIRKIIAAIPFNERKNVISVREIRQFDESLAQRCMSVLVKDEFCDRHPNDLQLAEVALITVTENGHSQLLALLNHIFYNFFSR